VRRRLDEQAPLHHHPALLTEREKTAENNLRRPDGYELTWWPALQRMHHAFRFGTMRTKIRHTRFLRRTYESTRYQAAACSNSCTFGQGSSV